MFESLQPVHHALSIFTACCDCEPAPAATWRPCSATFGLQIALSSDEGVFGGYENVSKKYDVDHQTQVRWQCLLGS